EPLRLLPGDAFRDGPGELLRLIPIGARNEGHDEMQPLSARELREALEADAFQALPKELPRVDQTRPRHAGARIEIEDQHVRRLESIDEAAPDVQLQCPDLHERHDARDGIDIHVLGLAVTLLDHHAPDGLIEPFGRMLLIEAATLLPVGATKQRQRTMREVRQNVLATRLAYSLKARRRDAMLGIHDPVGMRDPPARDSIDGPARLYGLRHPRSSRRRFAAQPCRRRVGGQHDLAGMAVLPEAAKDRMA